MNTIATPYHFYVAGLIAAGRVCANSNAWRRDGVLIFSRKFPQHRLALLRPIIFGRFGIVDAAKHMP
jgi:hypothetical protein